MKSSQVVSKEKLSLENIRHLLGLTQKELAQALGMSERSISRYENGEREPTFTISQIKAFRRKLLEIGLDFDDLPDSLKP